MTATLVVGPSDNNPAVCKISRFIYVNDAKAKIVSEVPLGYGVPQIRNDYNYTDNNFMLP